MGHLCTSGNGHCDVCGTDMEDLKRGLPGFGTDSFMTEFKCNFCGSEMDDYNPPDTREIWYRCVNLKCSGPPKLVKKELLDEALALLKKCEKPMAESQYCHEFEIDYSLLKKKVGWEF